MLDYARIKSVAAKAGMSVRDLLALSPINDPFYVGAKRQLEKGRWFAKVYEAMGSPERYHVRRVHYWLVTTQAVPKPDGKPYENTQNDWYLMTMAAKYARYLGLVPIEGFVDRRNPPPSIHAYHWNHLKATSVRDSVDESSIVESIVEQFWCFNPSRTQAYVCELWAEKSTMNDVLEPVAQQYGMNLVTGLGELSITAVHLLANRIVESRKPVRIFYISDFDPAGECMPVSVARKIEYFVYRYDLDTDIKLLPLMLTADQCQTYELPRTPIKETEKRKDKFEDRHGVGATELDALEALHPGEMERVIEEAIAPYFDVEKWNEAVRVNRELQKHVRGYLVGGTCSECDGIGEIILGEIGEEVNEVCFKCNGTGSIPGKIDASLMDDLDTSTYDTYTPPTASAVDDGSSDKWLYDSRLKYVEQIYRYRAHQQQNSSGNSTDGLMEIEDP